jgi:hypothetical protein
MVVSNYTSIQKRDKRVYAIFNTTVSKRGIALRAVKVSVMFLVAFSIVGLAVCAVTNQMWYNPLLLLSTSNVGYFYVIFVFSPVALGVFSVTYKIQNYVLIDYAVIYLMPKIAVDKDGKRLRMVKWKINTFVERVQ